MSTTLQQKHLERLRAGAVGWINAADSKAMAIVTVGGALMALLAAVLAGVAATTPTKPSPCELGLFVGFCVADLLSIGLAAWAIFPRTNRAAILQKAGWTDALPQSRTFFADVAKLSGAEFKKMISTPDEKADEADGVEQTFILQRIAWAKMWSIRVSIVALVASLAALTALLIVAAA